MVIIFLLSANVGTIVWAVAVWFAYGFWQAAILAPLMGCASGTLALFVAGRCQAGPATDLLQQDQISDQVSALAEIVKTNKMAGQQRRAALSRPSVEEAA